MRIKLNPSHINRRNFLKLLGASAVLPKILSSTSARANEAKAYPQISLKEAAGNRFNPMVAFPRGDIGNRNAEIFASLNRYLESVNPAKMYRLALGKPLEDIFKFARENNLPIAPHSLFWFNEAVLNTTEWGEKFSSLINRLNSGEDVVSELKKELINYVQFAIEKIDNTVEKFSGPQIPFLELINEPLVLKPEDIPSRYISDAMSTLYYARIDGSGRFAGLTRERLLNTPFKINGNDFTPLDVLSQSNVEVPLRGLGKGLFPDMDSLASVVNEALRLWPGEINISETDLLQKGREEKRIAFLQFLSSLLSRVDKENHQRILVNMQSHWIPQDPETPEDLIEQVDPEIQRYLSLIKAFGIGGLGISEHDFVCPDLNISLEFLQAYFDSLKGSDIKFFGLWGYRTEPGGWLDNRFQKFYPGQPNYALPGDTIPLDPNEHPFLSGNNILYNVYVDGYKSMGLTLST